MFTWSSAPKRQIRFPVSALSAYTPPSQVPTNSRLPLSSGDDSIGSLRKRQRSRPVSASQATTKPSAPLWSCRHSTLCM